MLMFLEKGICTIIADGGWFPNSKGADFSTTIITNAELTVNGEMGDKNAQLLEFE